MHEQAYPSLYVAYLVRILLSHCDGASLVVLFRLRYLLPYIAKMSRVHEDGVTEHRRLYIERLHTRTVYFSIDEVFRK